jgi:hypothetical protein
VKPNIKIYKMIKTETHRRKLLHPSPNFVGASLSFGLEGVERIKIIRIAEKKVPENLYVNVKFFGVADTDSRSFPIKYEDFKKGCLEEGKQILLYKSENSTWFELGVMVNNKFVGLDNANAHIPEVQDVKDFEFEIEYEGIN